MLGPSLHVIGHNEYGVNHRGLFGSNSLGITDLGLIISQSPASCKAYNLLAIKRGTLTNRSQLGCILPLKGCGLEDESRATIECSSATRWASTPLRIGMSIEADRKRAVDMSKARVSLVHLM